MFELVNGNPPGEIKDIQRALGTHLGIKIAKLCISSTTVSEVLLSSSRVLMCIQVLANLSKELKTNPDNNN